MRTTKAKFPSVGKTSGGGGYPGPSVWTGADYVGRYNETVWRTVSVGTKGWLKLWGRSGTVTGQTVIVRFYDDDTDELISENSFTKTVFEEPFSIELKLADTFFLYQTKTDNAGSLLSLPVVALNIAGNIRITADGPRNGTALFFNRLEYEALS